MASVTDENVAPANIQVGSPVVAQPWPALARRERGPCITIYSEQETASPVKPASCSPSLKASSLLTPSTEAESPDSLATPGFHEEACLGSEVSGPEEAEPSWAASALPQEELFGKWQRRRQAVRQVATEEAETSTEEDVAWMQCLPTLGLEKAPTSWIADALLAETMEAECDLAVLRDFPQVHQPSWLFQSSSSEMPRPSFLVRSPKCDPSTKAAAFSKLAQESDEEESDEEDIQRQAAFSKLREKCVIAASRNVAQEVNKAKWRSVLSNTCVDNFDLDLLEHIEPPRFTTV